MDILCILLELILVSLGIIFVTRIITKKEDKIEAYNSHSLNYDF
jgi:hypothetical protein